MRDDARSAARSLRRGGWYRPLSSLRWPWRSARSRRSTASRTPYFCGRCPLPMPNAWSCSGAVTRRVASNRSSRSVLGSARVACRAAQFHHHRTVWLRELGGAPVTAPGEPFGAAKNVSLRGFFDVFARARFSAARSARRRRPRREEDRSVERRSVAAPVLLSSDPRVVGTVLNRRRGKGCEPFEVIGVMPPASGSLGRGRLGPVRRVGRHGEGEPRELRWASARVCGGATPRWRDRAAGRRRTVVHRRKEESAGAPRQHPWRRRHAAAEHLLGRRARALLAIGGAAAMLLLIACANARACC